MLRYRYYMIQWYKFQNGQYFWYHICGNDTIEHLFYLQRKDSFMNDFCEIYNCFVLDVKKDRNFIETFIEKHNPVFETRIYN